MKHKILLVLLLGLMVSFTASAQKVTLQFRQVKLAKVFDAITQQTGLTVAYSRPTVDPDRIVTIEANKEELSQVLTQLMKGTNVTFEIGEKKIYLKEKPTSDVQQNRKVKTISGIIVDDKGEPVIGASIAVQGTTLGTITNLDGEYTLANVPENSEVTVSFIGYKTLIFKANDKSLANITLKEDTEMLDEVVVVGYGTVKKRDLTGSVASLNSDVISSVPATSAVEALQGRASGVVVSTSNWAPGETPSILIRGKRSINASNDPLFVVDGIPVTGGMGEISPSDIESMEVLKDASATAIYGSRGANGVIIITTKQGKEGKTQIDYNGYVGVQTIQNKLDLMNGAEYAEYTREAYRNSNGSNKYLSDTPNKEEDMLLPMFKQDPYVLESVMMAYDENGNYDPSRIRSYNWFDDVTRSGLITDHQLNIRGGGAKTNFMASVTYNKTEGIMKDKDYERYSIRFNISHNINKYITSNYEKIFGSGTLKVRYVSTFKKKDEETLFKRYKENYQKELSVGKTLEGIHHDDIVFILEADAETIHKRKQELTIDEINHQLKSLHRLAVSGKYFHILDAMKTPEEIAKDAIKLTFDLTTNKLQ